MFIPQVKKRGRKNVIHWFIGVHHHLFQRHCYRVIICLLFPQIFLMILYMNEHIWICCLNNLLMDQTSERNPVISSSSDALSIWRLVNVILYPDRLIKYPECSCCGQPITLQHTRWIDFHSCVAMLQPLSNNIILFVLLLQIILLIYYE